MKPFLTKFFYSYWDAIIASGLATIWLLLYTKHGGIGVCPDGITYLSVAKNFITNFSVSDFRGIPMVVFPLGYPLFLSLFLLMGAEPITIIGPILNCLLFTSLLFMSSYIFQQVKFYSSFARLLLLLFLTTSTALLEVYSMLWSETLFLFLLLLFFIRIHQYSLKQSLRNLYVVSIITALLLFVRFAGITCLITGGLIILLQKGLPLKQKFNHLVYYGLIGISLTTINVLYNKLISGTLTGVRQKAIKTVWENVYDLYEVFKFWFPFPSATLIGSIVVSILLLFVLALPFVSTFLQPKKVTRIEFIIAAFFSVYIIFMIAISSISRFETLNSRLLIPAFICLPILLANGGVYLTRKKQLSLRVSIFLILLSGYGFAQYHNYKNNRFAWEGVSYSGIPGYTDDYWKYSPMIDFIQKNPTLFSEQKIFSNAIDALYFLSNTKAFPLPHKDIKSEIDLFIKNKSFYLVWFFNTESFDLIQIDQIKKYYPIKTAWQFKDGVIIGF